jgi:hypothetical protein
MNTSPRTPARVLPFAPKAKAPAPTPCSTALSFRLLIDDAVDSGRLADLIDKDAAFNAALCVTLRFLLAGLDDEDPVNRAS